MNNFRSKTLKRANCNGVVIEVDRVTNNGEEWIEVSVCDQFDEWAEPDVYEDLSEAEAYEMFDKLVEEYKDKPNWNAQAAYDEAHGTVNGGDPRLDMWEY